MKYTMRVKKEGADDSTAWTETINDSDIQTLEAAQAAAKSIVDYFNRTIRPYESRRALVDVTEDTSPDEEELDDLLEYNFDDGEYEGLDL